MKSAAEVFTQKKKERVQSHFIFLLSWLAMACELHLEQSQVQSK